MKTLTTSNNITFSTHINSFLKNFIYLVLSMPLGLLYFSVATIGITFGVGTSIVYIGVPITAGVLILTQALFNFDKIIAAQILNLNISELNITSLKIPKVDGLVKKILTILKTKENWYSVLYCIIKLPIGIMNFTISLSLTLLSVTLILYPPLYALLDLLDINFLINDSTVQLLHLMGINISQNSLLCLYFILGIGLGYVTLKVVYYLAQASAKMALFKYRSN